MLCIGSSTFQLNFKTCYRIIGRNLLYRPNIIIQSTTSSKSVKAHKTIIGYKLFFYKVLFCHLKFKKHNHVRILKIASDCTKILYLCHGFFIQIQNQSVNFIRTRHGEQILMSYQLID